MWCLDGKYKSDCIRSLVHTRDATLSLLCLILSPFQLADALHNVRVTMHNVHVYEVDRNHSRARLHAVRVYGVDNHSEASACATESLKLADKIQHFLFTSDRNHKLDYFRVFEVLTASIEHVDIIDSLEKFRIDYDLRPVISAREDSFPRGDGHQFVGYTRPKSGIPLHTKHQM